MPRPRDYLQPRPRDGARNLVVMRAAGDAVLFAPDQQGRHRNLAEPRAAVDTRHDRALLREEGVGAGIGRHPPRDAEQAGVPPLLLGEEDRDAFLDDLTEIAALDQIDIRSEEHTSELQSLMRISYAVFCLKKKNTY